MEDEEPYVGPRAFARIDQKRFFARDREANVLLNLITAHRIVLLYSHSGAGKSSLLNARLVPLLEEDGFRVLPTARVRPIGISEGDAQKTGTNVYTYSVLACLGNFPGESLLTWSLAQGLSFLAGEEGRRPRVLLIDQFEELFTTGPWQHRRPFVEQLGEALAGNRTLRVILAMRQDYIGDLLDPHFSDLLPDRLRIRFRLEPLRRDAALLAVTRPLEGLGLPYAPGVAERLVDNLLTMKGTPPAPVFQGEFVEPVQLQIVCQSLWRSVRELNPPEITHEYLGRFGDVDQVLRSFYEASVARVAELVGIREGYIRTWLGEKLVTPVGTRASAWSADKLPEQALKELEADRLILSELRQGARCYELSHERLIDAIQKSNAAWRSRRVEQDEVCRFLENRAASWDEAGRPAHLTLTRAELRRAEVWMASPEAEELGVPEAVSALVKTSSHRQIRRKREAPAGALIRPGPLLGVSGALLAIFILLFSLSGPEKDGLAQVRQGDIEPGFAKLRRSLEEAGRRGDAEPRSEALLDLAQAYLQLGDGSSALDHLATAQELTGDLPENRARRLWLQGRALEMMGAAREAAESFQEGLKERTPFEARLLCGLGRVLAGRSPEAAYPVLLRCLRATGSPAERMEALSALGGLEGSERRLDEALTLAHEAGDPWTEIQVLVQKSRLPGVSPDQAAVRMEEAVEIAERLGSNVHARDLALLVSARFEPEYDLLIDSLLQLHTAHPHAGYAARAFAASEASQAAALARELRDRPREAPGSAFLERQHELLARLGAGRVNREPSSLSAAERVERTLLLGEYWMHRAGRPTASERGGATLEEVRWLLDPETVLLEYTLGEERSWLFVLSRNALRVFRLPPEHEVAQAVSSLRSNLRDPAALRAEAAALSRMLLAPAASELQGRRIAIVADGVLGQVPFALLPEPPGQDSLLLTRHEVVYLPSLSVLAKKRRQGERPVPAGRLAIVADPVISLSDPRLPPATGTLPITDPGKILGFRRFGGSVREAEGIARLYPVDALLIARGTVADRSTIMNVASGRYSILHLAIPVHVETERADESSLVLSMFDEQGRPQNGVIPGYELFGLRLPCDLVVLSSGQTAFGKLIVGEGFAGLPHAFFAAGAKRVIDTIWDIEDRNAAELMIRFHRHLASGRSSAAALRQAQLEMGRQSSLDWAAFRLEGDWK